jgi:hypothetical protein
VGQLRLGQRVLRQALLKGLTPGRPLCADARDLLCLLCGWVVVRLVQTRFAVATANDARVKTSASFVFTDRTQRKSASRLRVLPVRDRCFWQRNRY